MLVSIILIVCFIGCIACLVYQSNESEKDMNVPDNIVEYRLRVWIRSCKTYEQLLYCERLIREFKEKYKDSPTISTRVTRLNIEVQNRKISREILKQTINAN